MSKHFSFPILALFAFVIAGCGTFGDKDNTQPPAPLEEFKNSKPVKLLWQTNIGGDDDNVHPALPVILHGDRLYTATPDGVVRAFNPLDGSLIWENKTGIPISGGPGAGDGLVLVGVHRGMLLALSAEDGSSLWQVQLSSEVLSSPQAEKGLVTVRTSDGRLIALNKEDGGVLWSYQQQVPVLSLRGTSAPIRVNNMIISGFDNGKMAALDALTGKPLWEIQPVIPKGRSELERMVDLDVAPVFFRDMLYINGYQGHSTAISVLGGEAVWNREISSHTRPAVDYDAVYVSDAQSNILALERRNGKPLWKQSKLAARKITAPVLSDKYVIVADLEGYIHWLNREDGAFFARYAATKKPIKVSPVIYKGTVIVCAADGSLVAVAPEGEQGKANP